MNKTFKITIVYSNRKEIKIMNFSQVEKIYNNSFHRFFDSAKWDGSVDTFNRKCINQIEELTEYNDYVAFLVSDKIAQEHYDNDYACDEVWEHCVKLAKQFQVSCFNSDKKSLYECVYEFLESMERDERSIKC